MHISKRMFSVFMACLLSLALTISVFADGIEEITIVDDNNISITSNSGELESNEFSNINNGYNDADDDIENETEDATVLDDIDLFKFAGDNLTDEDENKNEKYAKLFDDLADAYGENVINEDDAENSSSMQLVTLGIKMLSILSVSDDSILYALVPKYGASTDDVIFTDNDPINGERITLYTLYIFNGETYYASWCNNAEGYKCYEITSWSSCPWSNEKDYICEVVIQDDINTHASTIKSWIDSIPKTSKTYYFFQENTIGSSNYYRTGTVSFNISGEDKLHVNAIVGLEPDDTVTPTVPPTETETISPTETETISPTEIVTVSPTEEVHVHSWHAVFNWMDESKFEYDRNGPLSDPTCTCSLACDECGAFENNVDVTLTIEDIAYPTCQNTTVTYRASIQERDDGSIDTLYEAKVYNMYAIHDWVINYQWDDSFTYSESYVVDGAPDFISRTNGAWAQSMLTEAEKNGDEKISFPYATCTCSVICADCNIQDTGVSLTKDVALSEYEKPSCDPGYATFTAEVSECYTTMLTDEEYENLNLNDEHTYEIDPVHDWVTEYTWGEEPTYVDDDTYTTTYEGTSYCSLCGIENDNLQQYTPVQTDLVQPSCRDGYVSFKVVIQEGSSDDDVTFVELGDGHEDTITYTLDGNGQHQWSTERYSTEWDVDEDGNPVCYFTVICGICGTTQVIEATSYETVTVKDPTCDDPGQTILQATLDNNGVVIIDNVGGPTEEIPALDSEHSWVVKDGSETWDPEAGSFTVDFECTECGEVVTEESEINFTVEYDENGDIESVEMEATVDYNGEEYTFDSDDVLGTGETPDYSDPEVQEEVKKIISGHNWVLTDSTEGTDGNPGTYEFECEDCEATITVTGEGADEVAKSVFNVSTSSSNDSSDSGASTYSSDSGSGATVSGSSSNSSSGGSSTDDTSAYETSSSGTDTNAMGGSTSSDYGTTSDAMGGTYGDEEGDGSTATTTSTPKTGDELLYVALLVAFIATTGIGCAVLKGKYKEEN